MLPPDMVGSQTLPPEIISAMIKNNPAHNFENLSEDEKQALIKEEKSRERNRDHSRKSRLRKKEFVESLKHEVGQLQVYQQICEQCMDCIALVAAEASAVFLSRAPRTRACWATRTTRSCLVRRASWTWYTRYVPCSLLLLLLMTMTIAPASPSRVAMLTSL